MLNLAVHIVTTEPKVNSEVNIPHLLGYMGGSVRCLSENYVYRTVRCGTANPLTINHMQHRKTQRYRRGGFVEERMLDVNAVGPERVHWVPL